MKKLLFIFAIFLIGSFNFSFSESVKVKTVEDLINLHSEMYLACETQSYDNQEANDQACNIVKRIQSDNGISPEHMLFIGEHYSSGEDKFIGEDLFLARFWIAKSAERGDADAQEKVGLMELLGLGGKQDVDSGIKWLEKSSVKGNQNANMILGSLYFEGKIVKRDILKAKEYYGAMCDAKEQIGCDFYRKANEEYLFESNK